jgi:hypothetical protein
MIPAGVEVFVATTPVDLRYGFERLSGIALERMGESPRVLRRLDYMSPATAAGFS